MLTKGKRQSLCFVHCWPCLTFVFWFKHCSPPTLQLPLLAHAFLGKALWYGWQAFAIACFCWGKKKKSELGMLLHSESFGLNVEKEVQASEIQRRKSF
jgi:hypothetical protein